MNVKQAVPFLSVADIQASLRFYVDALGFTMTKQWIDDGALRWCWLEHGTAALMLQQFKTRPENPGAGVTLFFICNDALASIATGNPAACRHNAHSSQRYVSQPHRHRRQQSELRKPQGCRRGECLLEA
jgi:catechol 2,3-dioxygenase-like lactoylglutathione lyase family enzyme